MKTLMVVVCGMGILAFGCSKPHKPDSLSLQGTWNGQEIGSNAKGSPSLVIEGSHIEFHGANTNEWYKAAFSLHEETTPKQLVAVITECPAPQYVGKTSHAIYQVADGLLTITANEPGDPSVPASFGAANARKFVFKMK